jgi:Zn-dependent peptidase ImmA (M78 family)
MHFDVLHEDRGYIIRDAGSSTAEDVQEVEANQFASNLLMPFRILQRDAAAYADIEFDIAVEELARTYEVSVQAMTLRVAKLEKWKP